MNIYDDNNSKINTDNDFEKAYNLCIRDYSHLELINMLINGSIAEKQIAALKLDYISDINDVNALLNNLTGCDGKIREAVAFKINSFLSDDKAKDLFALYSAEVFAKATIDINANICRMVVDSAVLLKQYKDFSCKYTQNILVFAMEALTELDKFVFKDKKYVINKQLFKLYWCLEALNYFYEFVPSESLKMIILKCSNQSEYTIREKAASLVKNIELVPDIEKILKNDENYYVRQSLHHPSLF